MRGQGPVTKDPARRARTNAVPGMCCSQRLALGQVRTSTGLADGNQARCSAIACAQAPPAMHRTRPSRRGDPQASLAGDAVVVPIPLGIGLVETRWTGRTW